MKVDVRITPGEAARLVRELECLHERNYGAAGSRMIQVTSCSDGLPGWLVLHASWSPDRPAEARLGLSEGPAGRIAWIAGDGSWACLQDGSLRASGQDMTIRALLAESVLGEAAVTG